MNIRASFIIAGMLSLLQICPTAASPVRQKVTEPSAKPAHKPSAKPTDTTQQPRLTQGALCCAVEYMLSSKQTELQSAVLVVIDSSLSEARNVASTVASHHPHLLIVADKKLLSHQRPTEISIHSLQWKSSDRVVVRISAAWGPRSGIGISLLLVKKNNKWQVTQTFSPYQI